MDLILGVDVLMTILFHLAPLNRRNQAHRCLVAPNTDICCEVTQHVFTHTVGFALSFYMSLQNFQIVTKTSVDVTYMACCETLEVITIATNIVAFCNLSVSVKRCNMNYD